MAPDRNPRDVRLRLALAAVVSVHVAASLFGITWGLPSRSIDKYLFGDGEVWPGEKIYRLAGAEGKFSPTRGADVDRDPLDKSGVKPIPLTATDEDVARILLRYRLYTYQPDEMITMMALAGMRPSKLDFDPRLYQYGGLFIYPVGALIKLCDSLGLIDVRSDVAFYLDHPDEFGKFYIVARAYSAAWGVLGVILVYAVTRRLVAFQAATVRKQTPLFSSPFTGEGRSERVSLSSPSDEQSVHARRAALLAALLFALLPVVVCMSHEGKPHLAGAVLMLLAVYYAIRQIEDMAEVTRAASSETERSIPRFGWMCASCGAALGMVLSSWPIFVLIPLVAVLIVPPVAHRWRHVIRISLSGTAIGLVAFLLTNGYVFANALLNREVLRSNFGNSFAMYEIARFGEGFLRVAQLTREGATSPIALVGLLGLGLAVLQRNRAAIPLIAVAAVFTFQFVLIGAGKPAEYGRFGVFTNTALAIAAASILTSPRRRIFRWLLTAFITVRVAYGGLAYLQNFRADATGRGSRIQLAENLQGDLAPSLLAVPAEPAPYNLPPFSFATTYRSIVLADSLDTVLREVPTEDCWFIRPLDAPSQVYPAIWRRYVRHLIFTGDQGSPTPISWANKPFLIERPIK